MLSFFFFLSSFLSFFCGVKKDGIPNASCVVVVVVVVVSIRVYLVGWLIKVAETKLTAPKIDAAAIRATPMMLHDLDNFIILVFFLPPIGDVLKWFCVQQAYENYRWCRYTRERYKSTRCSLHDLMVALRLHFVTQPLELHRRRHATGLKYKWQWRHKTLLNTSFVHASFWATSVRPPTCNIWQSAMNNKYPTSN